VSEGGRRTWTDAQARSTRPRRVRRSRVPVLPVRNVEPPRAIIAAAKVFSRFSRNGDRLRAALAATLVCCGLALSLLAVWADATLHRGVGDGITPPIVRQYSGRDLATNADFTHVDPEQLAALTSNLQAHGIRYVRQSFAWADIEATPNQYTWDRYDAVVDALTRRGITPVAVLNHSPGWIRSPEGATAFDAPPADLTAYERFVTALVTRYGDRVPFIQIWDLPNRPNNWGNASPDPSAYVSLLAVGANAARSANPNSVILLAELDPVPTGDGMNDLDFLRRIYASGGSAFFDIIAVRLDGGARTPFDRALNVNVLAMSRAILLRELIVREGDGTKPIWATHFGWDSGESSAGGIDASTQAAYAVAGLQRARAEWPWAGLLFQWGLLPGPDLEGGTPAGRALLQADGAPTPLLTELGTFAAEENAAPTGLAPVAAHQYVWEGNWDLQHLGPDTYRTTSEVDARFRLRFEGTGIVARARLSQEAGDVVVSIDDRPVDVSLASFQAENVDIPLARRLPDGAHEVSMRLSAPGELTLGGLIIERSIPMQWPILLLLGSGGLLLFFGCFDGLLLLAERAGLLQRHRPGELWPELPMIPEWRPARRA
jgi:hypothetical protein